MNENIRKYFDAIEVRLIESQAIVSYQIIRRDVSVTDGKMRIKSTLSNNDTFEFFIYMTESNQQLSLEKYSFHWQDKDGALIVRVDNAPHFPELPNAPHHMHRGEEAVTDLEKLPDLLAFLDEIEKVIL